MGFVVNWHIIGSIWNIKKEESVIILRSLNERVK